LRVRLSRTLWCLREGLNLTKCDRYWWHVNKNVVVVLAFAIALVVINPLGIFVFPIVVTILCERFLSLQAISENREDSLRMILALPFSRKDIFDTYLRMVLIISLLYFLLFELITNFLYLIKFKIAPLVDYSSNVSLSSISFPFFALSIIFISIIFSLIIINRYSISLSYSIKGIFFLIFFGISVTNIIIISLASGIGQSSTEYSLSLKKAGLDLTALKSAIYKFEIEFLNAVSIAKLIVIAVYICVSILILLLLIQIIKAERKKFLNSLSSGETLSTAKLISKNSAKSKAHRILRCPSCNSIIRFKHLQINSRSFECENCGASITNKMRKLKRVVFFVLLIGIFALMQLVIKGNPSLLTISCIIALVGVYLIVLFINDFKQEEK